MGEALRHLKHRFVVVIPVADRPQQLSTILSSLRALVRALGAGRGGDDLQAIVADDSAGPEALLRHREIVRESDAQGLPTLHFGPAEQAELWQSLPPERRRGLIPILGDPEATGYGHKGASVTRNFALLLARRIARQSPNTLFWFVDSDEQFRVRLPDGNDGLIDYLGALDRIFSSGEVDVLTGKVVGDPPVSPAVMAGNFLADVAAFLARIAAQDPAEPCGFHGAARPADDAAYHDMADLFGFAPDEAPFDYRCTLETPHDHAACLADFSRRLDRFFHGEHPTRIACYEADPDDPLALKPARTVYTGNYACTAAALEWFIPFAPLKLRMAGPTLGRLIKAKIGPRFVSANLPLLHARANEDGKIFEFRPGVLRSAKRVDLSGEFERQFFGDVMLFSVEALVAQGYPQDGIVRTVADIEAAMAEKYLAKRSAILEGLGRTESFFAAPDRWWNGMEELGEAKENFRRFFDNLRANFGEDSEGWQRILDPAHRARRRGELSAALAGYAADREAWKEAL